MGMGQRRETSTAGVVVQVAGQSSTSGGRVRLKKDSSANIMRDLDSVSPLKTQERQGRREITEEDLLELEMLGNLTKENEQSKKEGEEEVLTKRKPERGGEKKRKRDDGEKEGRREEGKVAMHLRVPKSLREYGLRNREEVRNKVIF